MTIEQQPRCAQAKRLPIDGVGHDFPRFANRPTALHPYIPDPRLAPQIAREDQPAPVRRPAENRTRPNMLHQYGLFSAQREPADLGPLIVAALGVEHDAAAVTPEESMASPTSLRL